MLSAIPPYRIRATTSAATVKDPVARDALWAPLSEKFSETSASGKSALRIAVALSSGTRLLSDVQFGGMDLSGIRFSAHDFGAVSFDGANLTNTEFTNCSLAGASFDNCLIKGTVFPVALEMVSGIRFGGLHRFYSAHLAGTFFDDVGELRRFIETDDAAPSSGAPACDAALQLRQLFGKFVREDGMPRRKSLDLRGTLRGKQFMDPETVLESAIRSDYLSRMQGRERVERADDDSYREIVKFRTELEMSPGVQALLGEVCYSPGCQHVF